MADAITEGAGGADSDQIPKEELEDSTAPAAPSGGEVGVDAEEPSKPAKTRTHKKKKRHKEKKEKQKKETSETAIQDGKAVEEATGDDTVAATEIRTGLRGRSLQGDAPDEDEDEDVEPEGPDTHGSYSGVFMATFNGQIESGTFPFHDHLYCTFGFVYGQDWQVIAGIQEGATQVTRKPPNVGQHRFAWNFPLEITFKSTNPFGWPQIFLQVYGLDSLGREVVRGYGARHLPLIPGQHELDIDMFVPVPSSTLKRLSGYLFGNRAEFIDPKFVASATGRSVTRVQSQGSVRVSVSLVTKDFSRYGFRVTSSSMSS